MVGLRQFMFWMTATVHIAIVCVEACRLARRERGLVESQETVVRDL